jgi:multidrug efflux pump subunit AcrA (membrane-fusion protein)
VKWLVLVLAACSAQTAPHGAGEVVRTAKVEKRDVVDRVLLTGRLRAASSVGVTVPRTDQWQLPVRWLVEDGVPVKAGERVAELDNSAFTKELEQKKLALRDAETGQLNAKALAAIAIAGKQTEVDQAKIALAKATLRADVPADLLTARDAQERQLEKKRAEINLKKAEEGLASEKQQQALELKVKDIELDKARHGIETAQATIDALVLKAPRDGNAIVENHPWLGRKLRVGDSVMAGMQLVTLPDANAAMIVEADLSDVDDGRAAVAMTGTCTLDAYPNDPIACTVKDVTPVARSQGEKSLRRTFAVTLTLAATKDKMRPGMSVKVELRRAAVAGLVVPRGAIVFDKQPRVRLGDGSLRDVTLGPCDAQGCAVDKGVSEGEVVRL